MKDHMEKEEMWGGWHGRGKLLCVCLVLLMLAVWLGFKARNAAREYNYIGVPIERNTIVVSGEGKVVAVPDVASVDLGMTVEKPTVADAQQENTKAMNALIDALKQMGIDSKDIQTTAYSVSPNYDWVDGKQRLRSYSVMQNVHVKIRKLEIVSNVLGKAGELGLNQIGGIAFTVDDPENLKTQARAKAIENAKAKAQALGDAAGVSLRRIVDIQESQPGQTPPPIFYAKAEGLGGAMAVPAPTVEAGSNEIIVDVNLTYEID